MTRPLALAAHLPRLPSLVPSLVLVLGASPVSAQEMPPETPPDGPQEMPQSPLLADAIRDPFAGFESWELENGLLVWYQRLEGAPNTSVSVSVPFGADQDPRGREELAHFTEHMLFSEHAGRTEQEIKDEIEDLGGQRNAFTFADHTFYYVTIGREHGLLALAWLGRLMEPHAMDPEVVERNRQPVANEIGARPREIGDRLVAAFDPEWLRRPGFWEREFGLGVRSERRWDRWESLHRIGPDDLRSFQERYYVPGAMIVTVVGDLPRDSVVAVTDAAFGDLRARPVPRAYDDPVDPDRYRRHVAFTFDPRPRYRTVFKLYEPTADEHVRLLFVRDLLRRRLGDRLRFGERKAAYSVSVRVVQRGPVVYLSIEGEMDRDDLDWAREVIDEELATLVDGSFDAGSFDADRRAVVRRLLSANQSTEEVNFQVLRHFWDRSLHREFPDLVDAYDSLDPEELSAFARRTLEPSRRVEWIERPHPLGQAGVAAGALLVLLACVRFAGRALTTPADMGRIRYVARIRMSLPALAVVVTITALGGAVLLRLWAAAADWVVLPAVRPVDSYALQMATWAAVVAVGVVLAVGWLSLLPRKILVFDDHVRIKHLAYRSRLFVPEELRDVAIRPFAHVWGTRRIFRTIPFTTGLFAPAVHFEPERGPGLYFRVRDPDGLITAVERLRDRSAVPGALAPEEVGVSPISDEG